MKEVKDIVIPSLEDIPLDNLIKYLKIFEQGDEQLSIYAAFDFLCGIPKDVVKVLSYKDALKVYTAIQDQLKVEHKFKRGFTIDGVKYGMIPNLEKASIGEFGDLDTYITPAYAGELKHKDAFRFMACLFRPITSGDVNNVYTVEDYEGTDKLYNIMKKAPASEYLNSVSFFLHLKHELLKVSQQYLNDQKVKTQMNKLAKDNHTKLNMDGLESLMKSQVVMLLNGMQQVKLELPKYSRGLVKSVKKMK